MKQIVRISVLVFGLLGTYLSVAIPQVPAPDGGPIITCPSGSCLPPAPM